MLPRIDLRDGRLADADLRTVLPRAALDVDAALAAVAPVCDDVRDRGAVAVVEATARFDGVEIDDLRVPVERLEQALDELDPAVRAALDEATRRARLVHEAQRRSDETVELSPGRHRHREVGAGPPGRAVRAGRAGRLSRAAS